MVVPIPLNMVDGSRSTRLSGHILKAEAGRKDRWLQCNVSLVQALWVARLEVRPVPGNSRPWTTPTVPPGRPDPARPEVGPDLTGRPAIPGMPASRLPAFSHPCVHRMLASKGAREGQTRQSVLAGNVARLVATATGTLLLNRRTGNRSVRAEHTTVTGLGPQQGSARHAVMEEDAGIRRHRLGRPVAALGAGQRAFQQGRFCRSVHGDILPRVVRHLQPCGGTHASGACPVRMGTRRSPEGPSSR